MESEPLACFHPGIFNVQDGLFDGCQFHCVVGRDKEVKFQCVAYGCVNNIFNGSFVNLILAEAGIVIFLLSFAFYKKMMVLINEYTADHVSKIGEPVILE